jgi:hypothetical protein
MRQFHVNPADSHQCLLLSISPKTAGEMGFWRQSPQLRSDTSIDRFASALFRFGRFATDLSIEISRLVRLFTLQARNIARKSTMLDRYF